MKENLPKMYRNKITKSINNIQKVYSSIYDNNNDYKYSSVSSDKKIDDIFR